jgi:pyruvate/2-oxoglutarate dehydrogenase complex dihydrolipoamide acyltransferase (E2) component
VRILIENKDYHILPFPAQRQLAVDAGRLHRRRNLIHGLLEFDVTNAREFIRQHKSRTGEALSFTAFLVGCLAQAVAAHPRLHAHRNWRNQLIVFDDVDIVILIEPEPDASPFPHIVRAANRKSFHEIHNEIRAIQAEPAKSNQKAGQLARWGPRLPSFVRTLFYRVMLLNPHWLKKVGGTVVVTAVGMFAGGGGWGFGFTPFHTLALTVGGIAEKPVARNGHILLHEFLCVTMSIDHDVVDGAPAARFGQCFRELVESGYGLCSTYSS